MKNIPKDLKKVLKDHEQWLKKDHTSWKGVRANLSHVDLSCLDLEGVNLRGANLLGANLSGTILKSADLREADMREANLSNANLLNSNLWRANLSHADLSNCLFDRATLDRAIFDSAIMYQASLSFAHCVLASFKGVRATAATFNEIYASDSDFSEARLYCTGFFRANIAGCNFEGADMTEACLRFANAAYARFKGTRMNNADLYAVDLARAYDVTSSIPMVCPESGSFIGWKKINGKIVCLEIPADAKRSSATSRKCRCDKAKVLSIEKIDGGPAEINQVSSNYDSSFIYKVGELVSVPDFCDYRWVECASGIHFFMSREEAVAW